MDNTPLETLNITSITGITACCIFIVQIIKRAIPVNSKLSKVPVFVYAILSAVILVWIANRGLKTSNGSPYLEGDFWKLIWAAVIAAASASGFFTWLKNPESVRRVKMKKALLIVIAISLSGCINTEKVILRETMDGMMQTIKQDHKEWADALTIDPETGKDHRERLPALTPNQKKQIDALHQEYQEIVDEDRERDKQRLMGGQQ